MADIFVSSDNNNTQDVKVVKPDKLPRGKARHKIAGHTHNPIAAFCYYPDSANFVEADNEEKIVLILRRHPITNIKWILTAILMILAPFFVPKCSRHDGSLLIAVN